MAQQRIHLLWILISREVAARYRGSALGLLWSLITPLFMLGVYTFVFGTVFQARWAVPGNQAGEHSTAEFALILFAGLTTFQFFSDVVSRAPMLILGNVNYVKKIVFPLEILAPVAVGAAGFQALVNFAVLLIFVAVVRGGLPWTVVLLPVVLLPLVLVMLGLAWLLAAVGTYVRDINQILGSVITALMFLSPIFFPRSSLPEWLQPVADFNPLTIPIEQVRNVMIFGLVPDWPALALYALAAIAIAVLGFQFFQKTRRGFADVL